MIERATNFAVLSRITPVFWISLFPVLTSSLYWLLVGVFGLIIRILVAKNIYLTHTASNARNAAEYVSTLRKRGYRGELKKLEELLPELAKRYPSSSTIYVKVVRPKAGDPPLTHYCAYTMPAHRTAIVFIGGDVNRLGGLLYFQALHEVGHALFSGQVHTLNRYTPLLQMWVVYFPICLFVPWWPFQLVIAALAIWHLRLETDSDYAEISADQFAIRAFDDTRGVLAREGAVRALLRHWRRNQDAEIRQRTKYLERGIGYVPPIRSVRFADWFRFRGQTQEVSIDRLGVAILERVNRGPVYLAALLVGVFYGFGIDDSFKEPSSSIALWSSIVLAPFACISFLSGFLVKREVERQSMNVAWILATNELEDMLDDPDFFSQGTGS